MDSKKVRVSGQAAGSVLKGDKAFSQRVLSRNSSVGHSSRVCYGGRTPEGVPFQWEMQPGTPKNPAREHDLPPLSPPPAVVSSGLPRPCIGWEDRTKDSMGWTKLKFWKKLRIYGRSHDKGKAEKGLYAGKASADVPGRGLSKVESLEFWSSDGDLVASPPRNSSASSLSTTLSFQNDANSVESLDHKPRSCSPWNLNALLVHLAKRI